MGGLKKRGGAEEVETKGRERSMKRGGERW